MTALATRDGFGQALKEIAQKDKNVIALDCDLGRSTRSFEIHEVDPKRFIEMGIAEQDMISTGVGMVLMGKIVFVNSFAVFITGRCFDQIRQQVSLPCCSLKICGSSAGLTQGPDGATHQSVIDVSLMRSLPNMTVLSPADPRQAEEATWAAYRIQGPVYLRLSRFTTGDYLPRNIEFEVGKAQKLVAGRKVAIFSYGPILKNVLDAIEILRKNRFFPAVYNFHTIKPFDHDIVEKLSSEFDLFVTVEEHSIIGGLGSCVAEVLAQCKTPATRARLLRVGIQDTFGESGTAEELLAKHGLDSQSIAERIANCFCETQE